MIRSLGVMTGTSCDGLDAACISVTAEGWEPLWSESIAYPKALRERVMAVQAPGSRHTTRALLELHRDLGEWYALSCARIIAKHRGKSPHVIANHGQTVAHFPGAGAHGTTLQLGDPTRIARQTGLTVISNFRDGDMAAGGQGAPLVPLFHRMVAQGLSSGRRGQGVAIHNIGGISNMTYVSPMGTLIAFDTGPGNLWIDAAAERVTKGSQKMDLNGRLARGAEVDEKAVRALLSNPYFRAAPPKSTGRDDFPSSLFFSKTRARGESLVATATAVTVESIAEAYERFIIGKGHRLDAVYVCGGGAKNPTLMEGLKGRLPSVALGSLEEAGLDVSLIEAQAFAMFGFLALQGQPLGGEWTGARGFGPPAHIVPGKNWWDLQDLMGALNSG